MNRISTQGSTTALAQPRPPQQRSNAAKTARYKPKKWRQRRNRPALGKAHAWLRRGRWEMAARSQPETHGHAPSAKQKRRASATTVRVGGGRHRIFWKIDLACNVAAQPAKSGYWGQRFLLDGRWKWRRLNRCGQQKYSGSGTSDHRLESGATGASRGGMDGWGYLPCGDGSERTAGN